MQLFARFLQCLKVGQELSKSSVLSGLHHICYRLTIFVFDVQDVIVAL